MKIEYSLIDDFPKIQKLKALREKADKAYYAKDEAFDFLMKQAEEKNLSDIHTRFYDKNWKQHEKAIKEYRDNLKLNGMKDNWEGAIRREIDLNADWRFKGPDPREIEKLKSIHPRIPDEYLPPIKKKGLTLLKGVAPIATAIGALTAPDMAQAAVDFVVPGGVEELGRDEEQKMLDQRYKERIRGRQEALNGI